MYFRDRIIEFSSNLWWLGALIFLVAFPLIFPSAFYINNMVDILINGLFAISLNLLVGYTGLLSLGHNAFFAIGSYTTAILLRQTAFSIPTTFLCGGLLAGLFAFLLGYLCTRLTKFYFAFLTLAFSQIIYLIVVKWVSVTGGHQGLAGGIPKPPIDLLLFSFDITSRLNFYYLTVIIVCASFILCRIIIESPFGWILRCIRENPSRAQFIGINVRKYQVIIFIIAGIFCSFSGGLAAFNINGAYVEHAEWIKGADPIFMILIGGAKTFLGPLAGAAVYHFLNTFVASYTRYSAFFLGAILIVIVIYSKMGIADFIILKIRNRRVRRGLRIE